MSAAVKNLCANMAKSITFEDVAYKTFVSFGFFQLFPEKRTALKELLAEEMRRQTSG
jgi:hypothetical protein